MTKKMEVEGVRLWLGDAETHQGWKDTFYEDLENQKFYEAAFERILDVVAPPEDAIFLDAGCGFCAHSIRLAKRGFFVYALDFSEAALNMGRAIVKAMCLDERIRIEAGNLIKLPFEDESFDYILCWGVLMHIPELEKAIAEITRVLRRGGSLVIQEGNMNSPDSILGRMLMLRLRNRKTEVRKTPAGIEYWTGTDSVTRFLRHANVPWLIRRFMNEGLFIQEHISGQFTEAYAMVRSRGLKDLAHHFNWLYFTHNGDPRFAAGNILIFRKCI